MRRCATLNQGGPRDGMAYVATLSVVIIMTMLGLAFVHVVQTQTSMSGGRNAAMQSQYLAESAVHHALWRLENELSFPADETVYYMHSLLGGRYGYKVRRHTSTTFATIATVGAVGDAVARHSYVAYVLPGTESSYPPLLYVVGDPTSLTVQESRRRALMGDWGFEASLIDDDATQVAFDAAVAENVVAYVSQEINATSLGTKLAGAAIGVVNESRDYIDEFGFAPSANAGGGMPTVAVSPWHYITSIFVTPSIAPYTVNEWYQIVNKPIAPGLQAAGVWVEAPWADVPCLMALETWGDLYAGGTAAGRRVQIPMGAGQGLAPVDIDGLSNDGRTLIKRSIEWAAASGEPLVLVVGDPSKPTTTEMERKELIESWGYSVTLMRETASREDFVRAAAIHEVIYVPQETTTQTLGEVLLDIPSGIVSEEYMIVDELGFTTGNGSGFYNDMNLVDNTHYVTWERDLGALALFDPPYDIYTGGGFALAPDLQVLGTAGTMSVLMALESGAALHSGGTASGRRIHVPWGSDFSALNEDGKTLMLRAIRWAAGAGTPLLFVVSSASNPTLGEQLRLELFDSWGYLVTLIDDSDPQANFDAAVDTHAVAYVSEEIDASQLSDKLVGAPIGVVNEDPGLHSVFGFSTHRALASDNSPLDTDADHYITSPFDGSEITLFSSSQPLGGAAGTIPPGLESIGTWASGALSPLRGHLVLEDGAAISGGGTAAGRRVQMPWGGHEGVSVSDLGALTADGQTLLRRSIEWAAISSTSLLLVVGDAAILSSKDSGREALMESWGYTVTLIDDGDTQANFNAAAASADVVYVSATIGGGTLADKLTGSTTSIVNEFSGKLDNFGFSSSTGLALLSDGFDVTNALHPITEPFNGNAVTAFQSSSYAMPAPSGTMAPGLQNVAEVSSNPALVALETGALRWDGLPAPARRVHLPFGAVGTDQLTGDGLTLMQRAIEWAANEVDGVEGVAFKEFIESKVGSGEFMDIVTPDGTATGDLLIAAVATDGDTSTSLSPPTGWSEISVGQEGSDVTFGVWWRVAGGGEPSQYRFTWAGTQEGYGWIMRFTGHDPSSPVATAGETSGSSKTPLSTNLITSAGNMLILRLGGFDEADITVDAPGLADHTVITMDKSSDGSGAVSGGAGYTIQVAAGDTGTSNFSLTRREEYRTVTIAIRPEP